MSQSQPQSQSQSQSQIGRALLAVLDNQIARTNAALDGVQDDLLHADPGGDCNCILDIIRHLVMLRRFQLLLLESPHAARVADATEISSLDELRRILDGSTDLLRDAIEQHDDEDWFRKPEPPRSGKWGDEPTIHRLTRPLNDFTNHLGAIRAVRRAFGNPAERTQ